jgi:hypothetical protein
MPVTDGHPSLSVSYLVKGRVMMDFDTILYAGLQLHATSDGADPEACHLVRRELLHEPASADPPICFAHFGGARFVTATGVGPEAAAGPGPSLTQAIATRDPMTYGGLRPAQLYAAPFWTTSPSALARCDPVAAPPPVGRPDVKSVQAFVNQCAGGTTLLAALLSALTGTTRVLFLAEQAEPVAMWIAAATLLMPASEAMRVSFKIFTGTPALQRHRILAMQPGRSQPPATVDRPGPYLVVDVGTGRCSTFRVESAALRWAHLFTRHDPVGVADAMDWTAGSGLSYGDAAALAEVLFTGRAPAAREAKIVVDWVRDAPQELVVAHGPPLLSAFGANLEACSKEVLGGLDRVTRSGRFPAYAAPVRLAWLSAELRAVAGGGRPLRDRPRRVAGGQWGTAETAEATKLVITALQAADVDRFAATLEVADRFDVPVGFAAIGPAAAAFVRYWARHPELEGDPVTWPCGAEAKEALWECLNEALDGSVGTQDMGAQWAPVLVPRFPLAPLDCTIIGARMAELEPRARLTLMSRLLDEAVRAEDPAGQVKELSRALWRWTPATGEEVRAFVDRLPVDGEIDPGVVDQYLVNRRHDGHLSVADLEMIATFQRAGRLRPGEVTVRCSDAYETLREIVDRLPRARRADRALAQRMAGVQSEVVKAYAGPLIKALLATPLPGVAADVVMALPAEVRLRYAGDVEEALTGDAEACGIVAAAVTVADRSRTPGELQTRLTDAVRGWLPRTTPAMLDRVDELLGEKDLKAANFCWIGLRGGRGKGRRSRG